MKKIKVDELIGLLEMGIYKALHIHHTWRPDKAGFNGENHIEIASAIKNYHVNVNGWRDIGYHILVFPDGVLVTGRGFDETPASAAGHNTGAFAICLIGNFDKDHDELIGEQKDALIKLTRYFDSHDKKILFHSDLSGKTCPGSSIDKPTFMREVREIADYNNHWAEDVIEEMMEKGIFKETNKFRPNDSVTRAEMAVIAKRILDNK